MSKTWLISDTHFGHNNIVTFTKKDGSWLRPWRTIAEHDKALIENWNSVVKPEDKVYHIGDLGLTNSTHLLRIMESLHGTKILIKGNHDDLKLSAYQQVFKDVRAYHSLNKILLAHIPIHPMSLGRWRGQIHGHIHEKNKEDDPLDSRYFNVAVEHISYTPIDFEEVNEIFNLRQ